MPLCIDEYYLDGRAAGINADEGLSCFPLRAERHGMRRMSRTKVGVFLSIPEKGVGAGVPPHRHTANPLCQVAEPYGTICAQRTADGHVVQTVRRADSLYM